MRVDDVWDYIVEFNATYMAYISAGGRYPKYNLYPRDGLYPYAGTALAALTDAMRLKDPQAQPGNKVAAYLDDHDEEVEETTPMTRIISLDIDFYIFVSRNTAAILKETAKGYLQGVVDTLHDYSYFFGVGGRKYFDGVDGNEDIKGGMVTLQFKYEEAV
jgi:hypothetical protein